MTPPIQSQTPTLASIDQHFKYIDNNPYPQSKWHRIHTERHGKISSDDAIVIRVKSKDGRWVERGITVKDFLDPKKYSFGSELQTYEQRQEFLKNKTGLELFNELYRSFKSQQLLFRSPGLIFAPRRNPYNQKPEPSLIESLNDSLKSFLGITDNNSGIRRHDYVVRGYYLGKSTQSD